MDFFVVFCINSVTGRGSSTAETPQALPHPVALEGVSVEGLGPGVNHPFRATKCRGRARTRQSSRGGAGGGEGLSFKLQAGDRAAAGMGGPSAPSGLRKKRDCRLFFFKN